MSKKNKQIILLSLLVISLLVIDQVIKIWVRTNMCLHESIKITDWFYLSFIENNGMAYGMTFIPKYALSIFRMIACVALGWYIFKQVQKGARMRWVVLLSLILAGAMGNLIDCMFYGLVFNGASPFYHGFFVDFGTGYAPFLLGRVVDMFYFPLIVTTYPDWFPLWAGEPFIFFSPVFNFADSCISVSVVALLLFCRKELSALSNEKA
ncbi:MAG: lipoprotein signal peptidase [Prevotella sp.]|nr:lipoprotein signal peptidase [Candidatus Prevotella equi]